ncbi:MAG: hypothetical protein OEW29_01415 [Acidimicrobiia bacterium]|nr:hypothetical protein [Acidimicrobiia bacterium]MDH4362606.1 hypothetical protein [Acidimicrobiia bacterium]
MPLAAATAAAPVGRPSVTLVVDAATLLEGEVHEATVCETDGGLPVPVPRARRCACGAVIPKVVIDERGGCRIGLHPPRAHELGVGCGRWPPQRRTPTQVLSGYALPAPRTGHLQEDGVGSAAADQEP